MPAVHESGLRIKDDQGDLLATAIPRVHMVKFGAYMSEDPSGNPQTEVDILARIEKGVADQRSSDPDAPKLHGFVLEGLSPYGMATESQSAALRIAAFNGMPTVKVGRSDLGGRVPSRPGGLMIEGNNLDANKARLLLMASMLKLGRLPAAKDPLNPTADERQATVEKLGAYQEIFESH